MGGKENWVFGGIAKARKVGKDFGPDGIGNVFGKAVTSRREAEM